MIDTDSQAPATPAPSIDQEILNKKVKDFEEKLVQLQAEFGLIIVPIINSTMYGIMADLVYMTKEEYNRRIQQAQLSKMGMKK